MSIASFEPSTLLIVLPEILLLVLAGIILVVGLTSQRSRGLLLAWLTALGLTGILVITLLYGRPGESELLIFGGMLRHDWMAFSFKVLFLFAAAMTALLSIDVGQVEDHGEYYALLVVATLGMSLMASSADLIMLFLAIEMTSIPLYILAGFMKGDDKSTEAGLKYFLFGALTSAVMLYGFSLLYGFSGDTNIYRLSAGMHAGAVSPWLIGGMAVRFWWVSVLRSPRSRFNSGRRTYMRARQHRLLHSYQRHQRRQGLRFFCDSCSPSFRKLKRSGPHFWLL